METPTPTLDSIRISRFSKWLAKAPEFIFILFAVTAAFSTYFCMYAFRKPFTAAKFEGLMFFETEVTLKTALVISQILGYALSKYVGIKVCSEIQPAQRAKALLWLILGAQLSLVLFGLAPDNWRFAAIFLNGLPLGMVWGLVVWYLEGRRTSEILLAGLSCSFIVSSGIVKDFGRAMMSGGVADAWNWFPLFGPMVAQGLGEVSEAWMPAVVGAHFLPLFFLSVWMLNQLPPPSVQDTAARTARQPMDGKKRISFVKHFLPGLALLMIAYFFLTAYRDFRDNYMVEILDGLGYPYNDNQTIISRTETLVAFGVMVTMALLNTIKHNRAGLVGAFVVMTAGVLLLGGSTLLFDWGVISGFWWLTLTGFGSYLAYVPYGSLLFDRMMASTKVVGTAVFAIYVADAIGYTGSVGIQLYKDLAQGDMSRLGFFKAFTWFMTFLGASCLISSCIYFFRKSAPSDK
ncbi:MAG: hypothetical protein HN758_17440 [Verrucomicrobia bacterium]|jgi:hypothetical protein|nr:hypothetical protein [Verrucomicrobiota bacterium]MBT4276200.1 hypothetical protein [Verrucomicrobiota bacterium]MBT5063679.1 hypothetical protein [Verrucomicrobiota bacterium]MBT5480453.1 hypothetical protein [Verrucomicrobiota bacterium]MBT6805018.1 hypothetical protein [Verrucomicrobiota bacterium]